jgi:membrane-associated protease RseP (regulator of RpoE activity)
MRTKMLGAIGMATGRLGSALADRERHMKRHRKSNSSVLGFGALLSLVAVAVGAPSSAQAQDLLKQLEDKLRGKQPPVEAVQPPSMEREADGAAETSDAVNDRVAAESGEELPMPGADASKGTTTEPSANSKRPGPIVFFPKKKSQDATNAPRAQAASPAEASPLSTPELPGGGFLGLTLEPVIGGGFGLAVVDVVPQSPAWKAGFKLGDRVIGVSGQAVTTMDQFAAEIEKIAAGSPVRFLVQRRGKSTNLVAVLQDRTLAGQLHGAQPNTALPLNPPIGPYQPIYGNTAPNALGFLGVSVSDISDAFRQQFGIPVYRGAAVSNVVIGSAAEMAGLRPGDCIVELDGRMILRAEDVVEVLASTTPGQHITIGYFRGRQRVQMQVPLVSAAAARSSSVDPSMVGSPMNARVDVPVNNEIRPEMLTPEYVASLHDEVARLQEQLLQTQERMQALEAQLQAIDRRR